MESIDYNTIVFLKKEDILEKIEDGHSGALLYKVIRKEEKFFLKIFNEEFNKQNIEKYIKCLNIYKELDIKTVQVIDYGEIKKSNQYYIVYNFIEGTNLRILTNSDSYTLNDIRQLGKHLGQKMLKLKEYKDYDKCLFEEKNIDLFVKQIVNNFLSIMNNEKAKEIITKYFTLKEINQLINKLNECCILVKKEEKNIIHGDIKRANIMMDNNNDIYVIDCESIQLNYDIICFTHQMTWCLFDGNEKEQEFVKGYFDGLYNNNRPDNFNNHVLFIIIINFFSHLYHVYGNKEIEEKLPVYMEKSKKLFKKISKMDFNNEFIM